MSTLHNGDPYNHLWLKYNRKHLIDMFDALHMKTGFHLSLDNCPERNIPRSIQYKRAPRFDINDDSDASLINSDGDDDPGSDVPTVGDDDASESTLPSFSRDNDGANGGPDINGNDTDDDVLEEEE